MNQWHEFSGFKYISSFDAEHWKREWNTLWKCGSGISAGELHYHSHQHQNVGDTLVQCVVQEADGLFWNDQNKNFTKNTWVIVDYPKEFCLFFFFYFPFFHFISFIHSFIQWSSLIAKKNNNKSVLHDTILNLIIHNY